ncbi:oligosaccharide flippase family protein [Bacteroides thetaiotaomicron]|nr:oligosaccharide flippase family protein [Bacteroides thetaiotaomicron]
MKNLSYLSLLQVANYIFPLITLPYLARVVGVDAFGLLAVGTSVIAYFQTLIDYGFNYTTVKEIARNKNDKPLINMIVMETMLARIILLVLSFTLIFLGIAFVPYLYENRIIILSTSTILVGYAFMLDWYFQAIEDMKFITLVNLVSNLVFTLSVFIFIHSPKDYFIQPLLTSAGTLVASFLCWIIIFRKYGLNLSIPSFYLAMARIKKGFNMFISLFLPTIYTNLNVLLLGAYNGTCATGIYSGSKFTGIAYRITMLFSRVFYPFLSRRMDKHSVYAIVSILIGFLISIFFFFGSDLLVQLFFR